MKEFTSTVTLTFEINNLSAFDKEEYIYFDPQNPEFSKKMVAKYGEDWHIDDFHNDTSDDFLINRRAIA